MLLVGLVYLGFLGLFFFAMCAVLWAWDNIPVVAKLLDRLFNMSEIEEYEDID